jgi:hypothetical protein
MRSQSVWGKPRNAIRYWLDLLLLVLVLAAKPEDWSGSRYAEWNTIPKDNWWQYKCSIPRCKEFFQSLDMPTYHIVCQFHPAIMKLVHDPTKG